MIRTASLLGCVALTVLPTSETVAQTELPAITVDEAKPARKKRAKPVRRTSIQPRAAGAIPATTPSAETVPPAPAPLATPAFVSQSETTASQILSRGGASLGDTLGTTAGVSATSFSPVASRPVIRGLGGFRVRTQENGIGSADMANLGEDHAVTIDPLIAGNVEVIRGPGTLRYGSQAIGGVVSATTGRIPPAIPTNGVAFESRGGLNSVSRGTDGAVLLDAGGGNVAIHADAFARKAGDYRIPGGVQENSSYRSDGHAVGGSYIFDSGFVGVAYQEMAMTYFIPGLDSAKVKNHIDLHQSKWTSRGEWRVGEYGLDAIRYWFGATNYKHNEINGIGAAEQIGSRFRNEELESRVEVSHLPFMTALGEWRGTAGVQWGQRNLSVAGATEPLLAPAKARNIAAFAFEELQLTQALRAQAALRIERTQIDGTGAQFPTSYLPPPNQPNLFPVDRTFMPVSLSTGLLYQLPSDIVARATLQHVERSPDPIEMFYKGPHDTPRTFEIGDPNMTLEKAGTAEIGLSRKSGATRFDASLYASRYRNFIFKNFTGVRCNETFASCGTPGASYDQIIYSQRDARFVGGEIEIEHDIARLWNGVWGLGGQYDIVHATFAGGGYVPKIPPQRLGGSIFYRDENWSARVSLLHAFAQTHLGAFETPTPGFNLLNAELSRTHKFSTAGVPVTLTVGLKGENLLNADIRLHQSYKKDEVLQPGQNVRLFASMKF